MTLRKLLFCISIVFGATSSIHAQTDSFCIALHALMADAANKFVLTKGATIDVNENAIKWEVKTQVPGVINARLVSSMGLFYEGALYQTKSLDALQNAYDQYKKQLSTCLGDQYKLTTIDNFNKGMQQYRKLIYMQQVGDKSPVNPPPHVSMEVDYYKPSGIYTIVMYVWEH